MTNAYDESVVDERAVTPEEGYVIDATGRPFTIPAEQMQFASQFGYTPVTPEEARSIAEANAEREYYNTGKQAGLAKIEAMGRGAMFGLSDQLLDWIAHNYVPDNQEMSDLYAPGEALKRKQHNEADNRTYEMLGIGASALWGGVGGLGEGAATAAGGKFLPNALLSAAKMTTEGAVYGGVQGAGQYVSDSTLRNKEIIAEDLLAHAGGGALLGAGIGAALSVPGAMLERFNWSRAARAAEVEAGVPEAVLRRGTAEQVEALASRERSVLSSYMDDLIERGSRGPDLSKAVKSARGTSENLATDVRQAFDKTLDDIERTLGRPESYVKGAEGAVPQAAWKGAIDARNEVVKNWVLAESSGQRELATAWKKLASGITNELDDAIKAGLPQREAERLIGAVDNIELANMRLADIAKAAERSQRTVKDYLIDAGTRAAESAGIPADIAALGAEKALNYVASKGASGLSSVGGMLGLTHGPAGAAAGWAIGKGADLVVNGILNANSAGLERVVTNAAERAGNIATRFAESGVATSIGSRSAVKELSEREYDIIKRDIRQLRKDPTAAGVQVAAMGLDRTHPDVAGAVVDRILARNEYLASKMPQQVVRAGLRGPVELPPTKIELRDFSETYRAATDPLGTLERAIDRGYITPREIDALAVVFPQRSRSAIAAVQEMTRDASKVSYQKRLMLSDIAGATLEPTLAPAYVRTMEQASVAESAGDKGRNNMRPSPTSGAAAAASKMTRTQRLGG